MSELTPELRERVTVLDVERSTRAPLLLGRPAIEQWGVRWLEPEPGWEALDAEPDFETVGHMSVTAGRLMDPDLYDDLDDADELLARIGEVILDVEGRDGLLDELEENLSNWAPLVLIVERLRFEPDYLHPGLPAYLVGRQLLAMTPGACLIAVKPAWTEGFGEDFWAGLGFKHFRDGVWLVDVGRFDMADAVEVSAQMLGLPPGAAGE